MASVCMYSELLQVIFHSSGSCNCSQRAKKASPSKCKRTFSKAFFILHLMECKQLLVKGFLGLRNSGKSW